MVLAGHLAGSVMPTGLPRIDDPLGLATRRFQEPDPVEESARWGRWIQDGVLYRSGAPPETGRIGRLFPEGIDATTTFHEDAPLGAG